MRRLLIPIAIFYGALTACVAGRVEPQDRVDPTGNVFPSTDLTVRSTFSDGVMALSVARERGRVPYSLVDFQSTYPVSGPQRQFLAELVSTYGFVTGVWLQRASGATMAGETYSQINILGDMLATGATVMSQTLLLDDGRIFILQDPVRLETMPGPGREELIVP